MTTLSDLRKNRSALMDKVNKALTQEGGGNQDSKEDKRFWKLNRDKTGNASAIIRFLPPMKGDELPWVKLFSHGFKGPTGKWYINESLSTIGLPDPTGELNRQLWETGIKENQDLVRQRKRKTRFVSNVLVIKDPANPQNEGKVFLYSYGKKIHDMIVGKGKPEFDDIDPCFVYDLFEGANFRLRITTKDDYANYDSSTFDNASELFNGDEDKLQAVIDAYIPLSEFIDPTKFKSYDDLKKDLDRALALTSGSGRTAEELLKDAAPKIPDKKAPKGEDSAPWDAEGKKEEKKESKKETPPAADDDDMKYFQDLLNS